MENISSKICKQCKEEKSVDHFGKNKQQEDGYHYYCRECIKVKTSKRKEKNKLYYKKWAEENKQSLYVYQKQYRKANRKKLNEYQRSRPDEKKRRSNCSDEKKQRDRIRRQDELYKQRRREYFKRKYKEDKQFQLKKQLEAQFHSLLNKNDETVKSINLLGCTIPEFKLYIQSKFISYMTFENYGEVWEFDHIIPFCDFDLTNEEEVKRCMHYLNLRPMFRTTRVIDGVTFTGNLNKNKY